MKKIISILIIFLFFGILFSPSFQSIKINEVIDNKIKNLNILPKKINFYYPFQSSFYADNPLCWLVIYNINHIESRMWAEWYQNERNIPDENMLGLELPYDEHLPDLETAKTLIFDPVRNYLNCNLQIKQRLIGFIVGYKVPGHYGRPPMFSNIGGFSITNDLQYLKLDRFDEYNIGYLNKDFPYLQNKVIPDERLNRATMTTGQYMAARIDAPTLNDAKNITIKAKNIEKQQSINGWIYYDYTDLYVHEWTPLKNAVIHIIDLPWKEFDADTEQTTFDSFRFGTHDVDSWNDNRLRGTPSGLRILAYNFNSFGATTVRSLTEDGGRYVPNTLDAGYASAIGSTGEPYTSYLPWPEILLTSLLQGWTLGESFYLSNPYHDWMCELHGDPFLQINGDFLPPD